MSFEQDQNMVLCTNCNETGHTRRACPGNFSNISGMTQGDTVSPLDIFPDEGRSQNNAGPEQGITGPRVIFCHTDSIPTSDHIIDLRKHDREHTIKNAPVYKETPYRSRRRTISFTDMMEARTSDESAAELDSTQYKTEPPIFEPILPNVADEWIQITPEDIESDREQIDAIEPKENQVLLILQKFHPRKVLIIAMALLLVLSLPLPGFAYYQKVKRTNELLLDKTTTAFSLLGSSTFAAMDANLPKAQQDLMDTLATFSDVQNTIDNNYGGLLSIARVIPFLGDEIESRENILSAGQQLALGNTYLLKGISDAQNLEGKASDRFDILGEHIRFALPYYTQALTLLNAVDPDVLPDEYQTKFVQFVTAFDHFVDDVQDISDLMNTLSNVFGDNAFKRYLVLFQNNHEIRPTGGFIGSYAVVDMQKGEIKNIDIPGEGSYALQGSLQAYLVPPLPLQLANGRWEFQDSNWFPDFKTSARKTAWFFENASGASVDGVIAINASVLERFLSVVGPVYSSEVTTTLDQNNALSTLQQEVELEYDKEENKPKAIIGALAHQFMGTVKQLDKADIVKLVLELYDSLEQREIQAYFNDAVTQRAIESFGWGGTIVQTKSNEDYLMAVSTNILGGKTDAKINQKITHHAQIMPDGEVIDTVTITKDHTGVADENFYGYDNIDYIRFYVPEGATLISAKGFTSPPEELFHVPEKFYEVDDELASVETEIGYHIQSGTRMTKEFGKTVFGNWMITKPGQRSQVSITYRLPFSMNVARVQGENAQKSVRVQYKLYVQKQSGSYAHMEHTLAYPDRWNVIWTSAGKHTLLENSMKFDQSLDQDIFEASILEYE